VVSREVEETYHDDGTTFYLEKSAQDRFSGKPVGDTLNVISVRINWNLNLKKYVSGKPFDTISMVMSPGHPLENVTLSCPKHWTPLVSR